MASADKKGCEQEYSFDPETEDCSKGDEYLLNHGLENMFGELDLDVDIDYYFQPQERNGKKNVDKQGFSKSFGNGEGKQTKVDTPFDEQMSGAKSGSVFGKDKKNAPVFESFFDGKKPPAVNLPEMVSTVLEENTTLKDNTEKLVKVNRKLRATIVGNRRDFTLAVAQTKKMMGDVLALVEAGQLDAVKPLMTDFSGKLSELAPKSGSDALFSSDDEGGDSVSEVGF